MDLAWYMTWLVDWEWCFCVSFNRREKLKMKIEVRPSFSITLNHRDKDLIQSIEQYFGCWWIRFSRNDQCYKYEVRSIDDLMKKIIPHFQKYPLLWAKGRDFDIFESVCTKVYTSQHKNAENLKEIIKESYEMNGSWKRKYTMDKLLSMIDKVKI